MREWHALTVAWWKDVTRSPMATHFLQADFDELFTLVELVDQFWWDPQGKRSLELAKAIRLGGARLGLSPMDRKRLQWEVATDAEPAELEQSGGSDNEQADPRRHLRAVR